MSTGVAFLNVMLLLCPYLSLYIVVIVKDYSVISVRYFASFVVVVNNESGRKAREAFVAYFNVLTRIFPLYSDEDLEFVIHTRIVSCFHCFVVLCVAVLLIGVCVTTVCDPILRNDNLF
jgi:hypothetical protein